MLFKNLALAEDSDFEVAGCNFYRDVKKNLPVWGEEFTFKYLNNLRARKTDSLTLIES